MGGDRAEPHFATLVAAVDDRPPLKPADTVMVPIQNLEELFA